MIDATSFVWDGPRPHIHPLFAPNGAVISADAPEDHPWHHGLWFTIKFVNGENFWEEYDEFGVLCTESLRVEDLTTQASIDWLRPGDAGIALREVRTITLVPIDETSYAIDWTESLSAVGDATLDRTPFSTWGGYGGLTLRGAPDFVDTQLRTLDGVSDRLLGVRAPWCAIDGTATTTSGDSVEAGVLFIDHPSNRATSVPWYASTRAPTYGAGWANFVNAAFLWDGPLDLVNGETLRLQYRVVVHDGCWDEAQCSDAALHWLR